MTVRFAMRAQRVTIDSPAVHAQRVMTALPVMTEPLGPIDRIGLRATSLPSATDDPSAKDATSMPRASSTVPFGPHATSDAMTARLAMHDPRVMTVRRATTELLAPIAFRATPDPFATTVLRVMTVDLPVMTVRLARTAATVRSARHVMTVVMTVDLLVTIAPRVLTVSRATTVPHAATRTSTRRVTKKPSTNPATMSCLIAFRQWQRPPTMSTV
jgi:hypothetical protein